MNDSSAMCRLICCVLIAGMVINLFILTYELVTSVVDRIQDHRRNELRDLICLLSRLDIEYTFIDDVTLSFTTEHGEEVIVIFNEKTHDIEVIR